jgi:hypothetical protein
LETAILPLNYARLLLKTSPDSLSELAFII